MIYTEEQQKVLDMARSGKSMKVSALAGTGKTTTLQGIAKVMQGRGLYLAFNKAIALEAQQRFAGTSCDARTFHSMAFMSHGWHLGERLGARLNKHAITKEFKLTCEHADMVAEEALCAVNSYLRSVDSNLSDKHFRKITHIETAQKTETYEAVKAEALLLAPKLYEAMSSQTSTFPSSHDVYLHDYVRSKPDFSKQYDYLLFDEWQDADPLMLALCESQHIPVFYVGDEFQRIYGWRGAVDGMSHIKAPEICLTNSFRFGSAIADKANQVLDVLGAKHKLKGLGTDSKVVVGRDQTRAYISRTNAEVLRCALEGLRSGRTVGVSGKKGILERLDDFSALVDEKPRGSFRLFDSANQLREFSETAPDVRSFLSAVDEHGVDDLKKGIEACVDLDADPKAWHKCQVVTVTAHKSKGLEFDSVKLSDDLFCKQSLSKDHANSAEELRLLYVAMTRAKHTLVLPEIEKSEDIFGLVHDKPTKSYFGRNKILSYLKHLSV